MNYSPDPAPTWSYSTTPTPAPTPPRALRLRTHEGASVTIPAHLVTAVVLEPVSEPDTEPGYTLTVRFDWGTYTNSWIRTYPLQESALGVYEEIMDALGWPILTPIGSPAPTDPATGPQRPL